MSSIATSSRANLLLDVRGDLWVTDFGLARLQNDPGLTTTGDLVGTLRYMSPEQAQAKHGVIDHRSDIYSLGATLYELLSLRPAFAGYDRQVLLRRIADEEPPSLRRIAPAIPRELETIVAKAMSKEPSERYATARRPGARPEAVPGGSADPGPSAKPCRTGLPSGRADIGRSSFQLSRCWWSPWRPCR